MNNLHKKIANLELEIAFYKHEISKKNKANKELKEQLRLGVVSRSLPTHKQALSKMHKIVKNHYTKNTEVEKANFRIGWQECFSWLSQKTSENG